MNQNHANPSSSAKTATPGAMNNSQDLSAALKGATIAFQGQQKADGTADRPKPPKVHPKPVLSNKNTLANAADPKTTTGVKTNGALLAATQAASASKDSNSAAAARSRSSSVASRAGIDRVVSRNHTGGSVDRRGELEHGFVAQRPSQYRRSSPAPSPSHLQANSGLKLGSDPKSASLIAAALAASRSGSPSPNHHAAPGQGYHLTQTQLHSRIARRPSAESLAISSNTPSTASPDLPDTQPIAPTTSLISIFETKVKDDTGSRRSLDPVKKSVQPVQEQGETERAGTFQSEKKPAPQRPKLRAMTPERPVSPKHWRNSASPSRVTSWSPVTVPVRKAPVDERNGLVTSTDAVSSPNVEVGKAHGKDKTPQAAAVTLSPRPKSLVVPSRSRSLSPAGRETSSISQPQASPSATQNKAQPPGPTKPEKKPKPLIDLDRIATKPQIVRRSTARVVSPQPQRVLQSPTLREPLTLPRRTSSLAAKGVVDSQTLPLNPIKSSSAVAKSFDISTNIRPVTPGSEASSDDTFVSASSNQSPRPASPTSPVRGRDRTAPFVLSSTPSSRTASLSRPSIRNHPTSQGNTNSSPSRPRGRRPSNLATPPGLPLDSLTSAIMAGNLASARLSPAYAPSRGTSVAPRRSNHHHHNPLHALKLTHTGEKTPPLTPQRTGMLQTLRRPRAHSDDEDSREQARYRRKGALGMVVGRKKHTHHEGARRRWRDEITPRERRRYEALWASNRGFFLRPGFAFQHPDNFTPPSEGVSQVDLSRAWTGPEADLVANVVVRDIWSRSRLPPDELAEVWELVDRGRRGALTKEEFVVGMWLIDQRLRGRKIPARVGESVWESARGGMRVIGPKMKNKVKK